MEEIDKEIKATPLLSISIPTWNRAKFLSVSLDSFLEQMKGINPEEVELFVSDNCSDDNTTEVVKSYIDKGLPITYNKNEENIGASRNFLRCMQRASGKYILLLGDDDVLNPGTLKFLLDILREKDYGLVHIHKFGDLNEDIIEYNDVEAFYTKISFWFTFVSGSIFRKDIVDKISPEKYLGTHLLQLPYFIKSAQIENKNLLLNRPLLKTGLDGNSNGGYNFYEVFVQNYLNIWHEFVEKGVVSKSCYQYLKKDIFVKFINGFNDRFFVQQSDIKDESNTDKKSRNGFRIKGAKKILARYYGFNGYLYLSMIKLFFRKYFPSLYNRAKKGKQ